MQFNFAGQTLDSDRRELRRGGELVAVEPQVFDLLLFLIENRDRVVSKDDLVASVWGGRIVSDSTLASRINAARKAIGDNGEAQKLIRTISRKGLRFVEDVQLGAAGGVGDWLRGQDLGKYEEAFRANAIDLDVLPDLTDDDLERLGMSLGDRKRLSRALANLPPSEPNSPAGESALPPNPSESARPAAASYSERRLLTVLFCELEASNALEAKLDVEDWRDLVSAHLEAATEAATGFGGHVLKKLGHGLMALFGYRQAQENDAERAVRAALAILAALEALNARNAVEGMPKLAARIGIDMGPVVVDATGEAFGEAPNVAARARAVAEPGTALVTAAVHRQIAGLFVVEEKGAHALKGMPAPVTLYRVSRASGGGRRGGARAQTPFVGREEDLAALMRRWERARGGQGQFVQIIGEPGLGKSRLIEEFRVRLGVTPHSWVEWTSSQLLRNTPLHPLAEWGRLRFGGADIAPGKRLAELESALAQVKLDVGESAALLAPLLDIPLPTARAPKLSPEELRRRQLAALASWILAGARAQPIVLAVEDLQWADPTTLDLLKSLVERAAAAPLFVVATTRPEFRAPWATRSHHGVVSLAPLDAAEIRAMVGSIAERLALSREVLDVVADRTAGVPLFVEEVTRLLLDRGDESGARGIPPTLQQSLAARLDRLGDAREIAQIGAVLGREFSHGLLNAVAAAAAVDERVSQDQRAPLQNRFGETALQSALDRLIEADLLFIDTQFHDTTYRFKHALIQDAAYESLMKSRRKTLHRRVAEALIAAPDPKPELVAHHFSRAGENGPAFEWWGKAGDAALGRYAFQEAIAHLGKAIEITQKGPVGASENSRIEFAAPSEIIRLRTNYARAMMLAKGYSDPDAHAAFLRARDEGDGVDTALEFEARYGNWAFHHIGGDLGSARNVAEAFVRDADTMNLSMEGWFGRRMLGQTLLEQGHFDLAIERFEGVLKDYDPRRGDQARLRFSTDPRAVAEVNLAIAKWHFGEFDVARALADAAVEHAGGARHPITLGNVHAYGGILHMHRRDPQAARRAAENMRVVSLEYDLKFHLAFAEVVGGWVTACERRTPEAANHLRSALERLGGDHGVKIGMPFFHGLLAKLQAEIGEPDTALSCIDDAISIAREHGRAGSDAFLHRVRGDILTTREPVDPAGAEDAYVTAIAVARRQGSRTFALQAALALAKLYQSTRRAVEAQAVLAPALAGFSPTPEMPEIADARALLASF